MDNKPQLVTEIGETLLGMIAYMYKQPGYTGRQVENTVHLHAYIHTRMNITHYVRHFVSYHIFIDAGTFKSNNIALL